MSSLSLASIYPKTQTQQPWQPKVYNPSGSTGSWGAGNGNGSGGSASSTWGMPDDAKNYFDKALGAWGEAWETPGISSETINSMKNQATISTRGAFADQQKNLNNQLDAGGLAGSGFGDAQKAALTMGQSGQLQNALSNIDIQAALDANKNRMGLVGEIGDLAGSYGQTGVGYANVWDNAQDRQLDWQKYFYQQEQDKLMNDLYEDQINQQNKWISKMVRGGGSANSRALSF